MALDKTLKQQLGQYLEYLEEPVVLHTHLGDDKASEELSDFVEEIAGMSDKLSLEEKPLALQPAFAINRKDFDSGIVFAGVPLGHEFESFVLALLQVSGRAPKITEDQQKRIVEIDRDLHFETIASLSCTNCPEVVQSLNIMSVLNPKIRHTMVDGGMYRELVEEREIMAVPTVFLNGKEFVSGRQSMDSLLNLVAAPADSSYLDEMEPFDMLIVGGGPSAAAAAIYAARKGIRTGIVCDEFGGQVQETLGIENMIGTPYIEGSKLMTKVREHVQAYPIEVIENQMAAKLEEKNDIWELHLESGAHLKAKTIVIATGARWREVGVPGEQEFKNKGIAYCAHCDGPLFKGKDIAVIGGGNSGIEAAIDLSGIVNHVNVIEFLPELKADQVLQERLSELKNISVVTNAQTLAIEGENKVNAIRYKDRTSNEETTLDVQGVFVQIGLLPDTAWVQDTLALNPRGEIVVDSHGATSAKGIYAAGDCTDTAYKQIIISMGSGATAALGAYDYLIRQG